MYLDPHDALSRHRRWMHQLLVCKIHLILHTSFTLAGRRIAERIHSVKFLGYVRWLRYVNFTISANEGNTEYGNEALLCSTRYLVCLELALAAKYSSLYKPLL